MTDEEWAFFSRYVESEGRGRPPHDHRRVLDAIFLVALTGWPWRDLSDEFGRWGSVYQQFRRWTTAGLWDAILDDIDAAVSARHRQYRESRPARGCDSIAGLRRLRHKVLAARALARRRAAARKRPDPSCC